MIRISVITCSWNSEKFLAENLESVWRRQRQPPFEQVIVDAGSTDRTHEIIAAYRQEFPIRVLSRSPGGIADAMNFGIRHAAGDAIQVLHSDDYNLDRELYRKAAAALEESPWIYGFTRTVDLNGNQVALQPHPLFQRYRYWKLLFISFIPHPSAFVAKTVFDEEGFFREDLRLAMDYEFWLRIGRKYAPTVIPEYWCAFRAHAGSLSTSNCVSREMLRERQRIFALNLKFPVRQAATVANCVLEPLVRILYHRLSGRGGK